MTAISPTDFGSPYGGAFPVEVRFGNVHHARAVYMRRRLVVAILVATLIGMIGVTTNMALADRGGAPASDPAIRLANDGGAAVAAAGSAAPLGYLVQPGDTMWSIAEQFHGDQSMTAYVEALVSANGGAALDVGDVLVLP